jgi:peptide/nickel transport system permease protein
MAGSSGFGRVLRDPLGLTGLILVVLMVASAVLADRLAPYGPLAINVRARLQPPDWAHWLGTDQLGRDTLSRLLFGGRVALQVALTAVCIATFAGLLLGLAAGYGNRLIDNSVILVLDAIRSFPVVMFSLAVVTLIGPSVQTIILIVIVTSVPTYARIVRTRALALRQADFVLAQRAMGAGTLRILATDIMPNLIGPLIILAGMDIPLAITLEAGLSFLGFGIRPPTPSWGNILNDGFNFIRDSPWMVIAGGIPLVVTTLGFTFLGEALRDAFDPKLVHVK